jgi:hypothetical protein
MPLREKQFDSVVALQNMYQKPFTHQSDMSPKRIPTQELERENVVLMLYWSFFIVFHMKPAYSNNLHTSFPSMPDSGELTLFEKMYVLHSRKYFHSYG